MSKLVPLTPELVQLGEELESLGGGINTRIARCKSIVCLRPSSSLLSTSQSNSSFSISESSSKYIIARNPRASSASASRRYRVSHASIGDNDLGLDISSIIDSLLQGWSYTFCSLGEEFTGKTKTLFGSRSLPITVNHDIKVEGEASISLFDQLLHSLYSSYSSELEISFCGAIVQANDKLFDLLSESEYIDEHSLFSSSPSSSPALPLTWISASTERQAKKVIERLKLASPNWSTHPKSGVVLALPGDAHFLIQIRVLNRSSSFCSTLSFMDIATPKSAAPDSLVKTQLRTQLLTLHKVLTQLTKIDSSTTSSTRGASYISVRDSRLARLISHLITSNSQPYFITTISTETQHWQASADSLKLASKLTSLQLPWMKSRLSDRALSSLPQAKGMRSILSHEEYTKFAPSPRLPPVPSSPMKSPMKSPKLKDPHSSSAKPSFSTPLSSFQQPHQSPLITSTSRSIHEQASHDSLINIIKAQEAAKARDMATIQSLQSELAELTSGYELQLGEAAIETKRLRQQLGQLLHETDFQELFSLYELDLNRSTNSLKEIREENLRLREELRDLREKSQTLSNSPTKHSKVAHWLRKELADSQKSLLKAQAAVVKQEKIARKALLKLKKAEYEQSQEEKEREEREMEKEHQQQTMNRAPKLNYNNGSNLRKSRSSRLAKALEEENASLKEKVQSLQKDIHYWRSRLEEKALLSTSLNSSYNNNSNNNGLNISNLNTSQLLSITSPSSGLLSSIQRALDLVLNPDNSINDEDDDDEEEAAQAGENALENRNSKKSLKRPRYHAPLISSLKTALKEAKQTISREQELINMVVDSQERIEGNTQSMVSLNSVVRKLEKEKEKEKEKTNNSNLNTSHLSSSSTKDLRKTKSVNDLMTAHLSRSTSSASSGFSSAVQLSRSPSSLRLSSTSTSPLKKVSFREFIKS